MPSKTIKIRAKQKGDVTSVKALITHVMETGLRKNKKTGKLIPAHFIKEVVAKSGGKTVMTAYWSGAVSKNPYIAFQFKGGKKGDDITLSWMDNKGESDSITAPIR